MEFAQKTRLRTARRRKLARRHFLRARVRRRRAPAPRESAAIRAAATAPLPNGIHASTSTSLLFAGLCVIAVSGSRSGKFSHLKFSVKKAEEVGRCYVHLRGKRRVSFDTMTNAERGFDGSSQGLEQGSFASVRVLYAPAINEFIHLSFAPNIAQVRGSRLRVASRYSTGLYQCSAQRP